MGKQNNNQHVQPVVAASKKEGEQKNSQPVQPIMTASKKQKNN